MSRRSKNEKRRARAEAQKNMPLGDQDCKSGVTCEHPRSGETSPTLTVQIVGVVASRIKVRNKRGGLRKRAAGPRSFFCAAAPAVIRRIPQRPPVLLRGRTSSALEQSGGRFDRDVIRVPANGAADRVAACTACRSASCRPLCRMLRRVAIAGVRREAKRKRWKRGHFRRAPCQRRLVVEEEEDVERSCPKRGEFIRDGLNKPSGGRSGTAIGYAHEYAVSAPRPHRQRARGQKRGMRRRAPATGRSGAPTPPCARSAPCRGPWRALSCRPCSAAAAPTAAPRPRPARRPSGTRRARSGTRSPCCTRP
mmetsp:Transcript_34143/g.105509  ORF Transcript_34143/g.105509 Transcript_34143/m.105509 type:complete len:308 (-) Transcript_34143:650-1573(-)